MHAKFEDDKRKQTEGGKEYHGAVLGDSQRAEAAVGKLDNLLVHNLAILVLVDRLLQHDLRKIQRPWHTDLGLTSFCSGLAEHFPSMPV